MNYDSIKIQKTVQDAEGHQFNIDWDIGIGRCPTCNGTATSPVVRPIYFKISDIVLNQILNIPKYYLLSSPNSLTRIHIVHMVSSDQAGVTVELFSNPTVTDNGTLLESINNDCNLYGTVVSELIVYKDPTVTDDGTKKITARITPGITPRRAITPQEERILKQNTKYLLKITPVIKDTNISMELNWIEVK